MRLFFLFLVLLTPVAHSAPTGANLMENEIEASVREQMPLPVLSVRLSDRGQKVHVITHMDASSVRGAKDPTLHITFNVERSASRQAIDQTVRAMAAEVSVFIGGSP